MKRPTYLELGRRQRFGRPAQKRPGPLPPPPDPATIADFDLGTWRVRPPLARLTRADRILVLEDATLKILLLLAERPPGGVNRDELAARVFGPGGIEANEDKFKRCLSFLRRAFSEDGAVRIVNAPGDCYVLEIGEPVPGRGLRVSATDALLEKPAAIDAWLHRGRRRALSIALAGVVVVAITIALIAIIDRGHVVLFGKVTAVAALAAEPGAKRSPSFSPDGRQLVYAWQRADGSESLYVRAVTGGAARPLTSGAGRDSFPVWSPSGALIAFQRRTEAGCSVQVVAPGGGAPRRLTDCDFGGGGAMTWMRDGSALIFTHRTAAYLPTQLVSVAASDGHLTGVTNPVSGMPGDSSPSLAPTGRRLAFLRTRSPGAEDLMLLELGGATPERITRDGLPLAGTAWEPAGLSVIYASPRAGQDALWRTRLGGGPAELVLARGEPLRSPALTNDGRALAFEHWRTPTRLARLALDAAAPGLPPWRAAGALERGARVAADRTRVVFVSNRGGRDRLWLAAAAGGAEAALTQGEFDYLETPRWSPDGRFIAFAAVRDRRFDVWTVDVTSGAEQRLTDNGSSRAPSFSRDGHWLYFGSAQTGHWQLYRRPWPGPGPNEVLTTEGGLAAIESRDGDLLYYVRADRNGLWERNREPGGDDRLVTPELTPIDWRNWEVDGDSIWFVTRPKGAEPTIARYALADGRVTYLQAVTGILADSGLALAPDGGSLLAALPGDAQVDIEVAALE